MRYANYPIELLRVGREGDSLSPAERQVLYRIALGDCEHEVATRLGKSVNTVKKQTKMARAKLGARTTTHAVAIAVSLDLI